MSVCELQSVGEENFNDSHKYRKKHFKEENIIFLLFIKEVDFQDTWVSSRR